MTCWALTWVISQRDVGEHPVFVVYFSFHFSHCVSVCITQIQQNQCILYSSLKHLPYFCCLTFPVCYTLPTHMHTHSRYHSTPAAVGPHPVNYLVSPQQQAGPARLLGWHCLEASAVRGAKSSKVTLFVFRSLSQFFAHQEDMTYCFNEWHINHRSRPEHVQHHCLNYWALWSLRRDSVHS